MKTYFTIIIISLICLQSQSQNSVLDACIREGLENNLALKQKKYNYARSLAALKEAKSLFYPDISINARYSVANGGRIIDFPVGTMLNPVYQSLNMLLNSQQFLTIDNMEFSFLRPHEHETKVLLIQPIFDPKIYYNRKISAELSNAQYADMESYKRELVAEIKKAWFNYLKTLRLEKLLRDTRKLLEENVRVNESLYRNDKVTIDNIYRSKVELSRLDQELAEAMTAKNVSAAYFNFLLNRPLEEKVPDDDMHDPGFISIDLPSARASAMNNREELDMLRSYSSASDYLISLNRSRSIPSLIGAVDYGFQGTKYDFDMEHDYVIASVVLRWELFHGFENHSKLSQAKIDRDIQVSQLDQLENQIQLQVIQSYYELQASEQSILASEEELASAKKVFEMVERKYREGQANLIEFIDARTTMTNAEQKLIISRYDHQAKYAEFERVAGLYVFE